jgi:hypothetical protein
MINDLREKKPVGNFLGPYVCGECIDVRDHDVLVGSYKSEDYLNIFDNRKMERSQVVNWNQNPSGNGFIYAAKWW